VNSLNCEILFTRPRLSARLNSQLASNIVFADISLGLLSLIAMLKIPKLRLQKQQKYFCKNQGEWEL
jgi:hypothetical protein